MVRLNHEVSDQSITAASRNVASMKRSVIEGLLLTLDSVALHRGYSYSQSNVATVLMVRPIGSL